MVSCYRKSEINKSTFDCKIRSIRVFIWSCSKRINRSKAWFKKWKGITTESLKTRRNFICSIEPRGIWCLQERVNSVKKEKTNDCIWQGRKINYKSLTKKGKNNSEINMIWKSMLWINNWTKSPWKSNLKLLSYRSSKIKVKMKIILTKKIKAKEIWRTFIKNWHLSIYKLIWPKIYTLRSTH